MPQILYKHNSSKMITPAARFFFAMLPVLISYFAREYRVKDFDTFLKENITETNFDFIVVGAGLAGCVVARRLADAKFKVLLLESGGDPPPIYKVPMARPGYLSVFDPDINYFYKTTKQKFIGLSTSGVTFNHAGKMMGGSGNHNGMFYTRGSPIDYEIWANATGDESWLYENIIPFFKKFENYHGNFSGIKNGIHGTEGPMTITSRYFPERDTWFEVGKELGYDFIDENAFQRPGFTPNENWVDLKGHRVSSYTAYIKGHEKSLGELLTIRRYSPVQKIIFEGKKAVGVEYERHGEVQQAFANKEVILCAGPFISPILLIKSGVGPRDELRIANIQTVQELPQVGYNLVDHVTLSLDSFEFTKQPQKAWSLKYNLSFDEFDDIVYRGEGKLGGTADAGAFITSSRGKTENPEWPDLIIRYRYQPVESTTCVIIFSRPYSRGRLTMNTSAISMTDDNLPILNYNYLSVSSDLDVMVEAIDFCIKAFEETNAFKELGAKYVAEPIEPCKHFAFRSANYWRCFVQFNSRGGWHTSGTCRMGKKGDLKGSVVDPELRVQGIQNLRVIDSSIFPHIPNANLGGPTLVTAEKVVDGVIKLHKKEC